MATMTSNHILRFLLISSDDRLRGELASISERQGGAAIISSSWSMIPSSGEPTERVILDCRRPHGHRPEASELARRRVHAVIVSKGQVEDAVVAARANVPVIIEEPEPHRQHEILQLATSASHAEPNSAPRGELLGTSDAIRRLRDEVARIAGYPDLGVLICGETGTGKELVAEAIHASSRCEGKFVPVNCAAIPSGLFESEFFGHEAGAFTGARTGKAGVVEQASEGTLFLDEVGELDHNAQAKLLRLLEARQFRRIASPKLASFNGRVLAATHQTVIGENSRLREDIYFRLATFLIQIPPLRERPCDIGVLGNHFLQRFCARYERPTVVLTEDAIARLEQHDWPGNARELRAVVERAAIVCREQMIQLADVAWALGRDGVQRAPSVQKTQLRDVERDLIQNAFDSANGNITHAAARLGIPRTTLRDKLRRYSTGTT